MPKLDRTGPMGQGAATGRGLGPCGAGMTRRGSFGRGFGWRRFWGYYPAPAPSKQEETEMISEEVEILENELKAAKERLDELKKQK